MTARFGTALGLLGILISSVWVLSEQAAAADPIICDPQADWFAFRTDCTYSYTEIIHVISNPGPVVHYVV